MPVTRRARRAEAGARFCYDRTMRIALALCALLVAPAAARADIFSARAEVHAGASGGAGIGGDQKDSAFFAKAPHGAYGALVGATILIADAYIDHTQYTDFSNLNTWTSFALGIRLDF